jgi:transcriptional regulator with XRE-family HTH domain
MAPTKPLTTLRAWHDSHGHTYESGAEAFGVSRATYARWLRYRQVFTLPRLAQTFGLEFAPQFGHGYVIALPGAHDPHLGQYPLKRVAVLRAVVNRVFS